MFGINEILDKFLLGESLTYEEKVKILDNKAVDEKVVMYLTKKLSNLQIEILNYCAGSLFDLMNANKLDRWCWQTTESAIVFFYDDDYIERGNLIFEESEPEYYHSWICFKLDGIEYVFDPCLNFLCKKEYYSKIFETKVKSRVSAKAVKEELIKQITLPKEDNTSINKSLEAFMKCVYGDSYAEIKKSRENEVRVYGSDDVNTPFYRNGAGYKAQIEDGKIKSLIVHYYDTSC